MPSYLTAGKIKEGMTGTISGEPREEKHDFNDGRGEKTLFRVPIALDFPMEDDYSKTREADWIWSPGVFARTFLEEQLGETYQSWINTHGSFHPKAYNSKNRSGFAWHFIPDTQESVQKVEEQQLKNFPRQVPSTPLTTTLIECAYCSEAGDSWSTAKPENMKAHVEKFHPDKVTQSPDAKVKVRAKKA